LKRAIEILKKKWSDKQNFTFLLVVLIIYIFGIIPLVDERVLGRLLFMLFYFLFLSSGIKFLNRKRKTFIVLILIVAPFLILFSGLFFKSAWLNGGIDLFIIFYCIWLGAIILKTTFSMGHVMGDRV
jgi:hypothetical protein